MKKGLFTAVKYQAMAKPVILFPITAPGGRRRRTFSKEVGEISYSIVLDSDQLSNNG